MTEIQFIERVLNEMAEFVRGKYAERDKVGVRSKSRVTDLLTEVDLEVQRRIHAAVREAFPNDQFIAEEDDLGTMPGDPAGRCWICDPIDGTQNFVRGLLPIFGVSLAFAEHGRGVAGGVCMPGIGALFLAERGAGAFRNGTRLHVTDIASIEEAWFDVDVGGSGPRKPILDVAADLMDRAGAIRSFCACVVGMCSVASGSLEGFIHIGLNPWDYAAAQIIVEEAGGRTSCFDGSPLELFGAQKGVVASNGACHDALLAALRRP